MFGSETLVLGGSAKRAAQRQVLQVWTGSCSLRVVVWLVIRPKRIGSAFRGVFCTALSGMSEMCCSPPESCSVDLRVFKDCGMGVLGLGRHRNSGRVASFVDWRMRGAEGWAFNLKQGTFKMTSEHLHGEAGQQGSSVV